MSQSNLYDRAMQMVSRVFLKINEEDQTMCFSKQIIKYRKQNHLTQEELANKLGITFQAVSKWENNLSYPDITLLPTLADIFGCSIDALFERESKVEVIEKVVEKIVEVPIGEQAPLGTKFDTLPWEDDSTLRVAVFMGQTYIGDEMDLTEHPEIGEYTFVLQGEYEGKTPENICCNLNLQAECITAQNVSVGGDVTTEIITGAVSVGGNVTADTITGNVSAGGNIEADQIGQNANAGGNITTDFIGGGANTGANIECGSIEGDVTAGMSICCAEVSGNAEAGTELKCEGGIGGHATAGANLTCGGDIGGYAEAGGNVTCGTVCGDATAGGCVNSGIHEGDSFAPNFSGLDNLGDTISNTINTAMNAVFSNKFGSRFDPEQMARKAEKEAMAQMEADMKAQMEQIEREAKEMARKAEQEVMAQFDADWQADVIRQAEEQAEIARQEAYAAMEEAEMRRTEGMRCGKANGKQKPMKVLRRFECENYESDLYFDNGGRISVDNMQCVNVLMGDRSVIEADTVSANVSMGNNSELSVDTVEGTLSLASGSVSADHIESLAMVNGTVEADTVTTVYVAPGGCVKICTEDMPEVEYHNPNQE